MPFNLPAGHTKAFFAATESESDDPGNPWDDADSADETCPHGVSFAADECEQCSDDDDDFARTLPI